MTLGAYFAAAGEHQQLAWMRLHAGRMRLHAGRMRLHAGRMRLHAGRMHVVVTTCGKEC